MKRNKGISLLEIIVAISLLVIISGVIITKFSMDSSRSRENMDRFYSDILYVRELAMNGKTSSYMRIDSQSNSYFIVEGLLSSGPIAFSPLKFVSFDTIEGNKTLKKIAFTNTGAPSYAGTITLKSKTFAKEEEYKVILDIATGNVRVRKGEKYAK